jgi:hypothetical protein
MPANTVIKLRAGTQSDWSATAKSKTVASASVVVNSDTVARYISTAHGFAVGNVVTITGVGVVSGNNPYNIAGGVISNVATDYFDIKLATGTTGGSTNTAGTAVLVVLAKGEAGFITDANSLKIGDGNSSWEVLPYPNQPMYQHLGTLKTVAGSSNIQNLFLNKLALNANTVYYFQIQGTINGIDNTVGLKFGFNQTSMTAWTYARYNWNCGVRAAVGTGGTTYYSISTKTFAGSNAGSSDATSILVELLPSTAIDTDTVFFTITGTIKTGNGDSYFQPQIQFTANPGTGLNLLAGSYAMIQPLGPSSIDYVGNWVAN